MSRHLSNFLGVSLPGGLYHSITHIFGSSYFLHCPDLHLPALICTALYCAAFLLHGMQHFYSVR